MIGSDLSSLPKVVRPSWAALDEESGCESDRSLPSAPTSRAARQIIRISAARPKFPPNRLEITRARCSLPVAPQVSLGDLI